jgi:hypothetical protein
MLCVKFYSVAIGAGVLLLTVNPKCTLEIDTLSLFHNRLFCFYCLVISRQQ